VLLAWKKVSRAMKQWRGGVYGCIAKSAHYKDTKQKETHIEKENTKAFEQRWGMFQNKDKGWDNINRFNRNNREKNKDEMLGE
jgi:hemerythrin-like domain-containing protein